MGDFRTYAHVIALRAVMSQDAMTADWARLPYDLLGTISNRIINEVKGINRVVFDISLASRPRRSSGSRREAVRQPSRRFRPKVSCAAARDSSTCTSTPSTACSTAPPSSTSSSTKAKELKFPAIALTDHGNLFGAIDFYLAAQKAGVKPILGCELYVAPGGRKERGSAGRRLRGRQPPDRPRAQLARATRTSSSSSRRRILEGFYYKPRVDRELLAQHADGLLVLSGLPELRGVAACSAPATLVKARETAGWYQEVFGKDHYFMEVQAHGLEEQARVTAETLAIARADRRPGRGTNDSHYLEGGHARAHEALLCIQTGSMLNDPEPLAVLDGRVLREVRRGDGARLRRDCRRRAGTRWRWPSAATSRSSSAASTCRATSCPSDHTLESYLDELAREGLKRRYGARPGDAIEARLAHELAVIEKMGFAGYFLVVWDFIHYARQQGIAVGPGRGSSAGSLVAYCLGITNIDPIRYGLLFERFLNPERISMPDMDIDFADDRRDEVIRYVAERYGHDRVAHIITFGTLGAKAAIRDVGRVLGMPYGDVDRIAKLVPNFPLNITLDDAHQKSLAAGRDGQEPGRRARSCGTSRARSRAARVTPPCTPRPS